MDWSGAVVLIVDGEFVGFTLEGCNLGVDYGFDFDLLGECFLVQYLSPPLPKFTGQDVEGSNRFGYTMVAVVACLYLHSRVLKVCRRHCCPGFRKEAAEKVKPSNLFLFVNRFVNHLYVILVKGSIR